MKVLFQKKQQANVSFRIFEYKILKVCDQFEVLVVRSACNIQVLGHKVSIASWESAWGVFRQESADTIKCQNDIADVPKWSAECITHEVFLFREK